MCAEEGVNPGKEFSGKFNVRLPAGLHAEIVGTAAAAGKSLNQWIVDTLDSVVTHNQQT